ncbi:MAG: nucleotidyltransferase family protein [Candidatus Aminicenantes bacterium]|nr:nucleotidyltransferase family protein [Candidatus Aminicenantes bacterium]
MKNSNLKALMALLKKEKPFLKKKYKVREIGIFGSYVRGDQQLQSDIDVLVDYIDNSIDLFDFLDLKEYLSGLMGKDVDLVMKSGLKPVIGKRILNQVIYV